MVLLLMVEIMCSCRTETVGQKFSEWPAEVHLLKPVNPNLFLWICAMHIRPNLKVNGSALLPA